METKTRIRVTAERLGALGEVCERKEMEGGGFLLFVSDGQTMNVAANGDVDLRGVAIAIARILPEEQRPGMLETLRRAMEREKYAGGI